MSRMAWTDTVFAVSLKKKCIRVILDLDVFVSDNISPAEETFLAKWFFVPLFQRLSGVLWSTGPIAGNVSWHPELSHLLVSL